MEFIRITKGFDLNIRGKPESRLHPHIVSPEEAGEKDRFRKLEKVSLLPEHIPHIKPRLLVKEGEEVSIGTPLVEDKNDTRIRFPSPGGGVVENIRYGPRRVIREIVIRVENADEPVRQLDPVQRSALETISENDLARHLLDGCVWPFLLTLPFRKTADPDNLPAQVFVKLDAQEPFTAQPSVYIRDREEDFLTGIMALHRLFEKVNVFTRARYTHVLKEFLYKRFDDVITHITQGPYPSDDPGVVQYHVKKGSLENRAAYIDGQDLCVLGRFLATGVFPVLRIISVGGAAISRPAHVRTRFGAPVQEILQQMKEPVSHKDIRCISGGIFTGFTVPYDSCLGFYETGLTVLPEAKEEIPFGFIRPGLNRPSRSRAFLSFFRKQEVDVDTRKNGEKRACVNCIYCARVCPVDILPHFTLKCVLAGDVEESLQHGLLDCVECGLCTYVCPSKIEIKEVLKKAKADFLKEQEQ